MTKTAVDYKNSRWIETSSDKVNQPQLLLSLLQYYNSHKRQTHTLRQERRYLQRLIMLIEVSKIISPCSPTQWRDNSYTVLKRERRDRDRDT
eukprot:scaffold1172_cov180-Ochromonas_danica.AAC.29